MSQTISEKIIARAAERKRVSPGEFVEIEPDIGPVMYAFGSNDPTKFLERTILDLGVDKMFRPEKFVIFFDHNQPAKTIEDASLFKNVKEGVRRLGIRHFYAMKGVSHSLMAELGLARPGMLLVHGDPHSSTLGGAGIYATNGGKYGGPRARAGEVVFQHSAHDVDRRVFPWAWDAINPGAVGRREQLPLLGKLTGPSSVKTWLDKMGITVPNGKIPKIVTSINREAELRKRVLGEEDLLRILREIG